MKHSLARGLLVVVSSVFLFTAGTAKVQVSLGSGSKSILTRGESSMKAALAGLKSGLASISTAIGVDRIGAIRVELNGGTVPLNEVADIRIPSTKVIEIRPRDVSQLPDIEKAIIKSDLGLAPGNDGKIIRMPVPKLTEARRREIYQSIHKITEEFRVAVRNERRSMALAIQQAERDKTVTEEERREAEAELDRLTDAYMKKIDALAAEKEKEMTEV